MVIEGNSFACVEQWFVYNKVKEDEVKKIILKTSNPKKCRAIGRSKNVKVDMEEWENIRIHVMKTGLEAKFRQNKTLAKRLKETYPNELVEINWWNDVFWGRCNGVGQNQLGKLLMEVREELIKGKNFVSGN